MKLSCESTLTIIINFHPTFPFTDHISFIVSGYRVADRLRNGSNIKQKMLQVAKILHSEATMDCKEFHLWAFHRYKGYNINHVINPVGNSSNQVLVSNVHTIPFFFEIPKFFKVFQLFQHFLRLALFTDRWKAIDVERSGASDETFLNNVQFNHRKSAERLNNSDDSMKTSKICNLCRQSGAWDEQNGSNIP